MVVYSNSCPLGQWCAQSCPTCSDPMDCSLPGSSAHGIFQERVPESGAIAFSAKWAQLGFISSDTYKLSGLRLYLMNEMNETQKCFEAAGSFTSWSKRSQFPFRMWPASWEAGRHGDVSLTAAPRVQMTQTAPELSSCFRGRSLPYKDWWRGVLKFIPWSISHSFS